MDDGAKAMLNTGEEAGGLAGRGNLNSSIFEAPHAITTLPFCVLQTEVADVALPTRKKGCAGQKYWMVVLSGRLVILL